MLDKLFIAQDAFAEYKDLSEHMDDGLMNTFIRESQVSDLIPFLGDELYLLMQNDFTPPIDPDPAIWATAKYEELFNGKDYINQGKEIRMHGIQPMLTLFAYARMLDNVQLSVARIGPVTYMEEETSNPTTQAQIKTKVINSRAMAVRYMQEVDAFLLAKRSDYPQWDDRSRGNKTFEFLKI